MGRQRMGRLRGQVTAVIVAAALAACGSNSSTPSPAASEAHGTLYESPPVRVASLDAATLNADLAATTSGAELLQVTGTPICGVDVYYLQFWTIGGSGESTLDSGALMVPTGAAPTCSGPRPIVLYAHATQTNKLFNIANISDPSNTEGALIAAMFAAQGYITVAPNYAGYDISTLYYHPFLNATQQSGEMIDILAAARTALPTTFASSTSDNGQLLITGFSEGGHVAMATLRAMEAAGMKVTAAAPISGPYALEALFDAVMFGAVDLDSTVFAPLVTESYQHEYGDIYTATSQLYSPTYATGIDSLLPSTTPIATIFEQGLLPETALFDSTTPTVTVPGDAPLSAALTAALAEPPANSSPEAPIFDLGFGSPGLLNNSVRVDWALDAAADPDGEDSPLTGAPPAPALAAAPPKYPLRNAVYLNDMRYGSWAPTVPTLLCGGDQDPTVYFSLDTGTMVAFWGSLPAGLITELDVNATPSGPFAAIQAGFQTSQAQELAYLESAAGGGLSATAAEQELIENYHVSVAPFCALAARSFFQTVLAE
jgi:acetyl esterase/lipase